MSQSSYGLLEWSSIFSNLAVIIAAILGILGFWQWRRELIGKTKFKIARRMIRLAQQFRFEYGNARNPWLNPGEWVDRKKSDAETSDENNVLNRHFAHYHRLQPLQKTLSKFWEVSWEAEVILIEEDAKLVLLFQQLFQDLYLAIQFFYEEKLEEAKKQPNIDYDIIQNKQSIIYGVDGDEVSKKVDIAVDTVKKQLKKYIQADDFLDIVKKFLKRTFI